MVQLPFLPVTEDKYRQPRDTPPLLSVFSILTEQILPLPQTMRLHALALSTILSTLLTVAVVGKRLASGNLRKPARIIVLYSRADPPEFRARCPAGQCTYIDLESFSCS